MKSIIKFSFFILFTFALNAQVGIGTTTPNGALEITSTTDGLLIPRVALTDLTTLTVVTPTQSEIVFNTTSNGTVEPGYYYLADISGTLTWVRFGGSGWLLDGNPTVTAVNFLGSINDADVAFKRFNLPAGKIGSTNTSFGVGALEVNTNTNNVAFGTNALGSSINGVESVAIGSNALSGSTAAGPNAFSGYANIAIGYNTLTNLNPGNDNVALGYQALQNNIASQATGTGNRNIGIGYRAGQNNRATGFIAIGYEAGVGNRAPNNIAIGTNTLDNHLDPASDRNIAIGTDAMGTGSVVSQTVSKNVVLGYQAGQSITSINNVAIGDQAGLALGGGESNIAIGTATMVQGGGSAFNVAIGVDAMFNYTGGSNVSIGYRANQFNGSGNQSVAIGHSASTADRTNSIAIGYQATASADYEIRLGNNAITQVITSGIVNAPSFLATGTSTAYADYVFQDYYSGMSEIKSDYKFNTLEKAEAFVIKNGHLPGVKSFAEVMENGFKLELTEATITNLEKLEEQFLYITELNKKIKTQENTISTQDEKIKALEARLDRIEKLLDK